MWPVWAELHLFGQPLRLTGYGLCAVLGAVLATQVAIRGGRRFGLERFDALAASVLAIAFGLLGAKLLYLAVSLERIGEVGLVPLLSQGGLVWYGGVLFGAAAVLVYARGYRLDLGALADCAAPAVAVGHAFGRVGCFLGGCCWGAPTSLPWGVRFPDTAYFAGPLGVALHPVQLYEAGAELALAALTWWLGGKVRKGGALALWLVGYGAFRLAIELGFRADDRGRGLFGAPPSVALSGLAMAAGAVLWLAAAKGLTTEKIVS